MKTDPFRKDAFATYAQTWGQAIRAAARSHRLFRPARGLVHHGLRRPITSRASPRPIARVSPPIPLGRENYDFARKERFILKEDRIFLKNVSLPHALRIAP